MDSKKNERVTGTKTCFVVMPIADIAEYGSGHFARVYEHLIKPACIKAGFTPSRADETKSSNLIILDILQQIYNADIVICDLSAKNPNVMYELGIRQAFELPTLLIKDKITTRIFDISALRDIEYDHSLRIDNVDKSISEIAESLSETYDSYVNGDKSHVNSIVSLLGISPARVQETKVSQDTAIILDSIKQLNSKINTINNKNMDKGDGISFLKKRGELNVMSYFNVGELVRLIDGREGTFIGNFDEDTAMIEFENGEPEIIHMGKLKKVPVYMDKKRG